MGAGESTPKGKKFVQNAIGITRIHLNGGDLVWIGEEHKVIEEEGPSEISPMLLKALSDCDTDIDVFLEAAPGRRHELPADKYDETLVMHRLVDIAKASACDRAKFHFADPRNHGLSILVDRLKELGDELPDAETATALSRAVIDDAYQARNLILGQIPKIADAEDREFVSDVVQKEWENALWHSEKAGEAYGANDMPVFYSRLDAIISATLEVYLLARAAASRTSGVRIAYTGDNHRHSWNEIAKENPKWADRIKEVKKRTVHANGRFMPLTERQIVKSIKRATKRRGEEEEGKEE